MNKRKKLQEIMKRINDFQQEKNGLSKLQQEAQLKCILKDLENILHNESDLLPIKQSILSMVVS